MAGCSFCNIVENKVSASKVHQDEWCTVFLDIRPINPGHMLVVPNRHAASMAEMDEDTAAQVFRVAMRMAGALRRSDVRCEGVNLHLADGETAGQEVLHVHLHVIPRYRGDGFGLKFSPDYGEWPGREILDEMADKIKRLL